MNFNKRLAVLALAVLVAATSVFAQRGGRGLYGIRRPERDSFKGSFTFCRIAFRSGFGGYGGAGASTIRAPIRICRFVSPS